MTLRISPLLLLICLAAAFLPPSYAHGENNAQNTAISAVPPNASNSQKNATIQKSGKAKTPKPEGPVLPPKLTERIDGLPLKTQQELKTLFEALHQEDRAIGNELQDDQQASASDILMLWQAAVERSGTIRYAIEKFSRRDATGKPVADDGFTKRMLESIAHLGGIAGSMVTGTPAGLIGGQMINELIQGDPSVSALSRVTDADMLILAKEIETLQSQIVDKYYQYRNAQEQWKLSREAEEALGKYYHRFDFQKDSTLKINKITPQLLALQPLIDSLYQETEQEETTSKQAFQSAETALGMLVGKDALAALEKTRNQTAQGDNK